MSVMDDILQKIGLKYEDLTVVERETLFSWLNAMGKNALTIENVKTYIVSMRDAVEQELTQVGLNDEKDKLLKARLRNYMLLEAFLTAPEKAKKALEKAMSGVVSRK